MRLCPGSHHHRRMESVSDRFLGCLGLPSEGLGGGSDLSVAGLRPWRHFRGASQDGTVCVVLLEGLPSSELC